MTVGKAGEIQSIAADFSIGICLIDGIATGERVYGYFPMGSHLVVTPDRLSSNGFVDASDHRAALPPVYNQYSRVPSDGERERETCILRPLFTTSFLLDDWLDDHDMFGATSVILGSASSIRTKRGIMTTNTA